MTHELIERFRPMVNKIATGGELETQNAIRCAIVAVELLRDEYVNGFTLSMYVPANVRVERQIELESTLTELKAMLG